VRTPAAGGGKRKAVKQPRRAAKQPSRPVVEPPSRPVAEQPSRPVVEPSRAARQPSRAVTKPSRAVTKPSRAVTKPSRAVSKPSRPAATPSRPVDKPARAAAKKPARPVQQPARTGGRKSRLPGAPSAPSLVGAAALALAAAGAITVSGTGLGSGFGAGDVQKAAAQASVLNGASSIGSSDALSGRQRAVSRDSERQALQDAADQRLQAAAEAQAKQRNAALAALAASAEKHATVLARNAWQLPIPLSDFHLTAGFGQCSLLWAHCHTGLDFAAPSGTAIHAIASGVVTDVGYAGAYGNRTIVTLSDGTELWYCHQTSYAVSLGQHVSGGQVIGTVGSTGNVTGPHLHVEVRPGGGDPVDPYTALVAHGLNLGGPNPA
jgi:murein DD-endopeptidase MepM/ murein hydrolase activator NlpD